MEEWKDYYTHFVFRMVLVDGDYDGWKKVKVNVEDFDGRELNYFFNDDTRIKTVSVWYKSHTAVLNAIIGVCELYKEHGFTQRFLEWSDDRHATVKKVKREIEEVLAA